MIWFRHISLLATVNAFLLVSIPQPAQACSFSWKPGHSPKEIKHRSDVRRIEGTFRVLDMKGTVDGDGQLFEGTIHGRVETKRGKRFDTIQDYSQFVMECGADRRPVSDGTGIFWISRTKQNGTYKMRLWEGQYSQAQNQTGSER